MCARSNDQPLVLKTTQTPFIRTSIFYVIPITGCSDAIRERNGSTKRTKGSKDKKCMHELLAAFQISLFLAGGVSRVLQTWKNSRRRKSFLNLLDCLPISVPLATQVAALRNAYTLQYGIGGISGPLYVWRGETRMTMGNTTVTRAKSRST